MSALFLYNFCLLLATIICFSKGAEYTFTGVLIIGVALLLPITASLREIYYLESDYWEEGMLPQIIKGVKKGAKAKHRWLVYSIIFWALLGLILLIISYYIV